MAYYVEVEKAPQHEMLTAAVAKTARGAIHSMVYIDEPAPAARAM